MLSALKGFCQNLEKFMLIVFAGKYVGINIFEDRENEKNFFVGFSHINEKYSTADKVAPTKSKFTQNKQANVQC